MSPWFSLLSCWVQLLLKIHIVNLWFPIEIRTLKFPDEWISGCPSFPLNQDFSLHFMFENLNYLCKIDESCHIVYFFGCRASRNSRRDNGRATSRRKRNPMWFFDPQKAGAREKNVASDCTAPAPFSLRLIWVISIISHHWAPSMQSRTLTDKTLPHIPLAMASSHFLLVETHTPPTACGRRH